MINIKNKKGQAAETLTWVIATIIIIVMTFIFIYVSGTLSRFKFSFNSVIDEDSGVQTQETLFAILQKKVSSGNDNVFNLIRNNKYIEATNEVNNILGEFSANNVKCNFYAFEINDGRTERKIEIEKGAEGMEVSVEFENKEVVLQC